MSCFGGGGILVAAQPDFYTALDRHAFMHRARIVRLESGSDQFAGEFA